MMVSERLLLCFTAVVFWLSTVAYGLKCGECFTVGRDCKPRGWSDNCDFCAKLTGQVVSPDDVPPTAMLIIRDNLPTTSGRQCFRGHHHDPATCMSVLFSRFQMMI